MPPGVYPRPPLQERFWTKVEIAGPDDCWLWRGVRERGGYGMIYVAPRKRLAHRIAYELTVGPIPAGFEIDHLCQVKACVNPAHLEAVTPAENKRRRGANKTHCIHGHLYTPANTYIIPKSGSRVCRTCQRDKRRLRERAEGREPRNFSTPRSESW